MPHASFSSSVRLWLAVVDQAASAVFRFCVRAFTGVSSSGSRAAATVLFRVMRKPACQRQLPGLRVAVAPPPPSTDLSALEDCLKDLHDVIGPFQDEHIQMREEWNAP
jgi:hypothetical protein